ncbi:MAG TPA: serine/threonine-protein kinase, partial [Candidatus Polarisedimenticolaceae bacterium]|nr:serine/threonine-protein kinase [Candidatus Polarisedimenticolaceae bacterium]
MSERTGESVIGRSECTRCGAHFVQEDDLLGACPRCLIGVGLADEVDDAEGDAPRAGPADAIGERFGSYRLVDLLGEGGMGVVYLADQHQPIRRKVAIKLIKLGMDTREIVARFESERRTLARMDHPNIAKVHEAGVSEDGRPFFVMEYVPGTTITRYCDDRTLDVASRVRLFIDVCRAIQHAHQKGVIHRDIKPTNVLVTPVDGAPVVKVIDFGVAKAIDPLDTGQSWFTRRGVMIGTPEYMSPEQAAGSGTDVDTRTDVYALGLILYELLTGNAAIDRERLRTMSLEQIRASIRDEELPRPSARYHSTATGRAAIARLRRTTPVGLGRELRGDLDWIVMTALAKDRERRYASPGELADDLERHLDNRPVLAGPPTAAYRLRKFVLRHRVAATFGGSMLVLLIAFTIGMTVLAGRIARERDRANLEARAASQVSQFMIDLFEVSDPGEALGETIPAREILERGARRIEQELGDQPALQARLMATIGT